MSLIRPLGILLFVALQLVVCCSLVLAESTPAETAPTKEAAGGYDTAALAKRIEKSMAQLSAEDRKLAEAQKFCPVGVEFDKEGKPVGGLLGSINKPVKLMVKGEAVFIMCPSCTEEFKDNIDKYMKVLAKIRASQAAEK